MYEPEVRPRGEGEVDAQLLDRMRVLSSSQVWGSNRTSDMGHRPSGVLPEGTPRKGEVDEVLAARPARGGPAPGRAPRSPVPVLRQHHLQPGPVQAHGERPRCALRRVLAP